MLRAILLILLTTLVARAIWRIIDGILLGLSGQTAPSRQGSRAPARGVQMVRDPVCGVYVVPNPGLVLTHGSTHVYFCSAECRDKYRARPKGQTA
jgi:YHS domain-containing protein